MTTGIVTDSCLHNIFYLTIRVGGGEMIFKYQYLCVFVVSEVL